MWLQGDNPGNSNDSRHYGAVPLSLVLRRAVFKVSFNALWDLRISAIDSNIRDEQHQYLCKEREASPA